MYVCMYYHWTISSLVQEPVGRRRWYHIIVNQFNLLFLKIHLNVIIPFTPRCSKCPLFKRFRHKISVSISCRPAHYMLLEFTSTIVALLGSLRGDTALSVRKVTGYMVGNSGSNAGRGRNFSFSAACRSALGPSSPLFSWYRVREAGTWS